MPKGYRTRKTLDKEAAREALREMVKTRLAEMVEAQMDNAMGIRHLMLRDPKTGKFERVTDEAGIDAALASEGQAVWIYTKDPSTPAFTDLMNRTIDKPTEQMSVDANVAANVVYRWQGEE